MKTINTKKTLSIFLVAIMLATSCFNLLILKVDAAAWELTLSPKDVVFENANSIKTVSIGKHRGKTQGDGTTQAS